MTNVIHGSGTAPSLLSQQRSELIEPNYQAADWPPVLRRRAKRYFDIAGAIFLFVVCLPAISLIAIVLSLCGGPVLFRHERVGRNGRSFGCLKFRTMVTDADSRLDALLREDPRARAEWEATRKLRDDPRTTWVGRFLRAFSLDELPQLFNVVAGDMSLVGPRPVTRTELSRYYGKAACFYVAVRPGITGPWQVSGRSDAGYDCRVALDIEYVRCPSLRTDLRILASTLRAVLHRRGAY